jgi:hypothetical protein
VLGLGRVPHFPHLCYSVVYTYVNECNLFSLQGLRKALVTTSILACGLFCVHRVDTYSAWYELEWFAFRLATSLNQTLPIKWIMCVICELKFLSLLQLKTSVFGFGKWTPDEWLQATIFAHKGEVFDHVCIMPSSGTCDANDFVCR